MFYCVEKKHSSEWITNLSMSQFTPVSSQNKRIEFQALGDEIKVKINKLNQPRNTYVIFDDWSVSGRQLRSILEKFNNITAEAKEVNLVFAVAFITEAALEYIQAFKTNQNFKLTLIYDTVLSNIYEQAERYCIEENTDINEFLNNINLVLGDDSEFSPEHQVLAFSDWKTLDFASMPENFTMGITPSYLSLTGNEEVNRFIPDTRSPYHKVLRKGLDSNCKENAIIELNVTNTIFFNNLIKNGEENEIEKSDPSLEFIK